MDYYTKQVNRLIDEAKKTGDTPAIQIKCNCEKSHNLNVTIKQLEAIKRILSK
jgi:hypothetical protein